MALSVSDLWKLLVQSRLLTEEQCRQLSIGFSAIPGAADAPGKTLAEWLVRQNVLSKYQAVILLASRAGPFFYGDYKIYDRLESGRLAGTFRAVHAATNHPVMLRFLAGPVTQSPQAWAEIQRWIPVTVHPHVTRYYEAVDLGAYKFLVLEDLRGQSLATLLERTTRIAADEASRLTRMAALGLTRLHDNGRVHGDVRPANLWLETNGNLKLLIEPEVGTRIFNLQTAANEPDGLARADYAAPELAQPGRSADSLVDIYALGCSLYQMISGQPPFSGGDIASKLQRHAVEAIKPLDSFGGSPLLTQLIAYCMAKNPTVRFQQAAIVAEQLVQFVGGAQQNLKPTNPLASQTPFELWLQSKQGPASAARPVSVSPAVAAVSPLGAIGPIVASPAPTIAPGSPVINPASIPVVSPAITPGPGAFVSPGTTAAKTIVAPSKTSSVSAKIKQRAKAKKRNNLIFLVFSVLAVAAAIGTGIYVMNSHPADGNGKEVGKGGEAAGESGKGAAFAPPSSGPLVASSASKSNPTATTSGTDRKADSSDGPATATVVPDDGQALWSSPTAGQAIRLKYVPPGAQLFLIARPSSLLGTDEGKRVIKALGPQFDSGRQAWETAAGVKLDDIEQVIVALYANQGKAPRAAYVVQLKAKATPEELLGKWSGATPVEGLEHVYKKGETAFYIPPDDPLSFVMGPLEPEFKDAAEAGWKPPLLRREIGQLLQVSDDQRHVTILFAPNFLFGDGQELFSGDLSRALKPVEWFLGDGLKSGLLSLHLADNFYFEMRMESDIQTDRFQLASHVRERMAEIPGKIESYIAELNPHPYWRLVAFRYPAMIRFLHEHTRIGVEGNHAMLNAVLPRQAAHNLVFGGEMVLASTPGVAMAASATTKSSAPKNIDEVLQAKISIAFAQDSLEFSMQNIVTEVKAAYPEMQFDFQIKILGTDLEKDGITRNQQLREFNQQNKTVAEILTAMVLKANPVTTVKSPNELDQKLLWVIGANPDNPAQQVVLITTRAAAAQKKYTLPEVFRPK